MIGFLLRKTFYDLWDNMFKIVVINFGFIIIAMIPAVLTSLAVKFFSSIILEIAITAAGILVCSVYLAAAAYTLKPVSDYGTFGFGDFFSNIKKTWSAGLVMGFFVFLIFLVATVVIPFYLSMESPVMGLALAAVIFWAAIFALLSFQFYFAVYARLGSNLKKSFKKCMIISLDNSGFSLFMLLHNTVALVLSLIFIFLFPGPAGVLLYLDEALRLRILKYDWLEANPDANRRRIPWDALLIDEREKTGTRSLKNFIFPWKD
jgi:hypothetical protein